MSSSGFFRARITVENGDTQEVEIWDDELTPFEGGKVSIREWVREHLGNYDNEALRELLGLPATGNFEAVIEGVISGSFSEWTQEWDEDLEIRSTRTQSIPDSFYEDLDEKYKGLDDSGRE
jgi:hypothetical protein